MVDMHAHVLPGMDDGASSVEESIAMLKSAYNQGVRCVVATSHCHAWRDADVLAFLDKRTSAYQTLLAALEKEEGNIPKLLLGAEVALSMELTRVSVLEKLCIGNTNCILLEPMFENMSEAVGEWIYEIGLKGFVPIVAHIDRYSDEALQKMGIFQLDAVLQINADTFLRMGGRRRVSRFLNQNKMFVVGSDMHNLTLRKCEMEKAYKMAKKMDVQAAEALFYHDPSSLLDLL